MPAEIPLEEVWKLFRETDAKFRETDAKFRETDRTLAQLEAIVARTSRNVDDLTGKWGKFVEGMVAPLPAKRCSPIAIYRFTKSSNGSRPNMRAAAWKSIFWW